MGEKQGTASRLAALAGGAALCALGVMGCDDDLKCGDGTERRGGTCVSETHEVDAGTDDAGTEDVTCGRGTSLKDGECVADTPDTPDPVEDDAGAPDPMSEEIEELRELAERHANERGYVGAVSAKSASFATRDAIPMYIGYPLVLTADLEIIGAEPFRTFTYFGLETKSGDKACVVGRIDTTFQPEAFEKAEAANLARAESEPPPSSFAACSDDEPCENAAETCEELPMDPQDPSAGSASLCVRTVASDAEAVLTARDFGTRKDGRLSLRKEVILPEGCKGLAGENDLNLWLVFDPFDDTELAGRELPDIPNEIDLESALSFLREQRLPYSSCDTTPEGSEPAGCPTGVTAFANPGLDWDVRKVELETSVLAVDLREARGGDEPTGETGEQQGARTMPLPDGDGVDAEVDLQAWVETSVYGAATEEDAEELLDSVVDVNFAIAPRIAAGEPGADDPDNAFVSLEIAQLQIDRAGEEETLTQLEELVVAATQSATLSYSNYPLLLPEAVRTKMREGSWAGFEQFLLRVCERPSFEEAEEEGIGLQNNCRTVGVLVDRGGAEEAEPVGGASSCAGAVAEYGALHAKLGNLRAESNLGKYYMLRCKPDTYQAYKSFCSAGGVFGSVFCSAQKMCESPSHMSASFTQFQNACQELASGFTNAIIAISCTTKECFTALYNACVKDRLGTSFELLRYDIDADGRALKVIPEDGKLQEVLATLKVEEKQTLLARNAAWSEVTRLCAAPKGGYGDVIGKSFVDMGRTYSVGPSQFNFFFEGGFRNRIRENPDNEADYGIEVGPYVTSGVRSDATGFSFEMLGADALAYVYPNDPARTRAQLSLRALTLSLYDVSYQIPDEYEFPETPEYSRSIEICKVYGFRDFFDVKACGFATGTLGVEVVFALGTKDMEWSNGQTYPFGEATGTVRPFAVIDGGAKAGIDVGLGEGGVRVHLDPLVEAGLPLTGYLNWNVSGFVPAQTREECFTIPFLNNYRYCQEVRVSGGEATFRVRPGLKMGYDARALYGHVDLFWESDLTGDAEYRLYEWSGYRWEDDDYFFNIYRDHEASFSF